MSWDCRWRWCGECYGNTGGYSGAEFLGSLGFLVFVLALVPFVHR